MKALQQIGREWLDTLVVAISVAMAFRAYFYEPFNIPTGSMMPTLYGNHSETCDEPGVFQKTPLKWLNWIFSGRDYKELTTPAAGFLVAAERRDGRTDFVVQSPTGRLAGKAATLPTDARMAIEARLSEEMGAECRFLPVNLQTRTMQLFVRERGRGGAAGYAPLHLKAGATLWRGYDTTGDFIFVNRWRWNLRAPARGDVMVFATTGINGLEQGTHYIKRMTALPGETIEISKPDVIIDGKKIATIKPMVGARGEKTPEPNPGLNGGMTGPVTLGEKEYFACGDNSDNSYDSRYWGAVPERNLRGVGAMVFWPIINSRWGIIR